VTFLHLLFAFYRIWYGVPYRITRISPGLLFYDRPEDSIAVIAPLTEVAVSICAVFAAVIGKIIADAVEDEIIICFFVDQGLVAPWVHRQFVQESGRHQFSEGCRILILLKPPSLKRQYYHCCFVIYFAPICDPIRKNL